MTDHQNEHRSRRKFISLGLLAGAGMLAGDAAAQVPEHSGETVRMLTREGKLVEIDKALLSPPALKKHASKRDLLDWIRPGK